VFLNILFSRPRTAAQALACLLFVFFSVMIPRRSHPGPLLSDSEIHGTVTECWEGNLRPVADLRVYVLATQENSHILALLKNIEQAPVGAAELQLNEYLKRCDELATALKALGEPSGLTRTDNAGRFAVKKLKQGEGYVVIAIDWDKGDSDEIFYYRSQLTGPLERGLTILTVYMGPGEAKDCNAK
jgi:hypothetical protein